MKGRLLLLLLLAALWFPVPTLASRVGARALQAAVQERRGDAAPGEPYESRERRATDLESFQGGGQVIVATEYDLQILVSILAVASVILVVLLV